MTQLAQRLSAPIRVLRASPLRVLTGVTIAMSAVAVYVTSLRLERVFFALGLDEAQVAAGVKLPAAAFDGYSTGTIEFSMSGDQGFDTATIVGNGYIEGLRTILLPYYVSELINALLVLALCAVVLLLCIRMLRGGPFVAPTTASLAAFAVVLGVGSIASQLVRRTLFGPESEAVYAARDRAELTIFTTDHGEFGQYFLGKSPYAPGGDPGLDLFPLGIAILIGLIAAAFWIGHRMQRDTQGLV